ncbi:MAG: EamA family transporter [Clostridia bacterium]|nr:EamA family transporter [Clostridia bacterium]
MLYLLLAIVSSALVSLTMRFGEDRAPNRITMLAVNYAACTLLAALFTRGGLIASGDGASAAYGLGAIGGAMFLGGFLMLQWNVRTNGVVLSSTFMKLGVIVPTVLAVTVFGESPRLTQLAGLALAVAAILIINLEKGGGRAKSSAGLLLLLLCGGLTDSLSKVYEQWGRPEWESHYLLYVFLVALGLSAALCLCKKQGITWTDVLCGLVIGVPNYFSARFLLLSLGSIPAVLAYPTYSVATIVAVSLAGVIFFREKLSRRQLAGMGVILAAIALLNL